MSDLIDRQHAIDKIRFYITEPDISDDETKIEGYNDGLEMAISILSILSSAEPERTAKVETVEKPNVFKCSECGQYFHSTSWGSPVEYCSRCGCRLDWNEDIPMEYFESGGR